MQFSCFPVLPGSTEAHVNWCDTVKCLLIAYFTGKISAKKSKSVHTYQSYSKPKVGRFLRHGVIIICLLILGLMEFI